MAAGRGAARSAATRNSARKNAASSALCLRSRRSLSHSSPTATAQQARLGEARRPAARRNCTCSARITKRLGKESDAPADAGSSAASSPNQSAAVAAEHAALRDDGEHQESSGRYRLMRPPRAGVFHRMAGVRRGTGALHSASNRVSSAKNMRLRLNCRQSARAASRMAQAASCSASSVG